MTWVPVVTVPDLDIDFDFLDLDIEELKELRDFLDVLIKDLESENTDGRRIISSR